VVNTYVEPFLFFKGFMALQAYRMAHWLRGKGRTTFALHFQGRYRRSSASIFTGAELGRGIMMDHGTGRDRRDCGRRDDVSMLWRNARRDGKEQGIVTQGAPRRDARAGAKLGHRARL
jgi:hypothetical protein